MKCLLMESAAQFALSRLYKETAVLYNYLPCLADIPFLSLQNCSPDNEKKGQILNV